MLSISSPYLIQTGNTEMVEESNYILEEQWMYTTTQQAVHASPSIPTRTSTLLYEIVRVPEAAGEIFSIVLLLPPLCVSVCVNPRAPSLSRAARRSRRNSCSLTERPHENGVRQVEAGEVYRDATSVGYVLQKTCIVHGDCRSGGSRALRWAHQVPRQTNVVPSNSRGGSSTVPLGPRS